MGNIETVLSDRLASLVAGMGYEYVGCEWHPQGGHSTLRLYIDREGRVGVSDCATVSRQVSAVLDVEELVSGRYFLEVSSPGIERPLFTPAQYERYVGQKISLRLRELVAGRRRLLGVLVGVREGQVTVQLAGEEERTVPLASVARAHLVADFFQEKKS